MSNKSDKLVSLVPLEEIEPGAVHQIYENLLFDVVKKMAIMPDVHQGYDLPIGAVALVEGYVSPGYVGYDIGCGMCSVDTKVKSEEVFKTNEDKKNIHHAIKYGENAVIVGFDRRTSNHSEAIDFESASGDKKLSLQVNKLNKLQLGTLGGGNHFIELGSNKLGNLCITVHSGSRKCGFDTADWYMKRAKNEGLYNKFLAVDSDLGQAYLNDLVFFQDWALDNRLHIVKQVLNILGFNFKQICDIIKESLINENHNHAVPYGDSYVHRKGATPAELGQLGVIPGNMRDGVYITRGLGNDKFLKSASHGAGRVLGRKAAKKAFSEEDFDIMMLDSECFCEKIIDECPEAYKDLDTVIKYQKGIVIDIIDHITPIVNVKG